MRIVAGTLRGRTIDAPTGDGTRPTTDRVREALFSSLYSLRGGFEGAVVLDAFAGSGALGLEALSRGARRAVLYERDAKAAEVTRKNVRACKLDADQATVVQRDVMAAPPLAQNPPFDLVFLDPPYAFAQEDVVGLAARLRETGAIAPGAIIVYEHAYNTGREAVAAAEAAGFEVQANRRYGKTGVTTFTA